MKQRLLYISLIISLVCAFSSCISTEETGMLQNIKAENLDKKEAFKEYRLAVGDILICNITCSDRSFAWDFNRVISTGSSFSGKPLTIYEDVSVVIPFFGSVKVIGLTVQQAQDAIQKKMQESILDAQVQLSLSTNIFYIYSKDRKGSYLVYKDNLTIYQALAISGQTTQFMDLSQVRLLRKDAQGITTIKEFDLRSINVVESEYYYIQPNDVLYFPTNKNSYFNITSLSSFFSTITTPITFLLFAATYKF